MIGRAKSPPTPAAVQARRATLRRLMACLIAAAGSWTAVGHGKEKQKQDLVCAKPSALSRAEKQQRKLDNYTEKSLDPGKICSGCRFSHLEPQLQLAATAKYSTVPPIRRASATIGQRGRFERGRSLQNALPRHPAVRWARPHFRPRSAAPGRLQGAAHHLGRGCSSCWPPESKRQMQQAPPYAFLTMATELERACNWPTNLQAPV